MNHLPQSEVDRAWDAIGPQETFELFRKVNKPWWIAGGWSIEFFVGNSFRAHEDMDVLFLRKDQLAFQAALPDWEIYACDPPGSLRIWQEGEILPESVHDIWCRKDAESGWGLQFMISDSEEDRALFRRDNRISYSFSEMTFKSDTGFPCLAAKIQLLYKSKGLRPKDELDFEKALPLLDMESKKWLIEQLEFVYDFPHKWLQQLKKA